MSADGDYVLLQAQSDMIYRWLKNSAEPYEDWEWDGETLQVWHGGEVIERYTRAELRECLAGFR